MVADAHQGRGIGSVLLEHLAEIGRELGVARFEALVLVENATMLRVFLDAGYQPSRQIEGSEVSLEFDIAATELTEKVMRERELRAESSSIRRLLYPRSVAVVGASSDPGKLGHLVVRTLQRSGFSGPIYPVNFTARSVGGVPAYPSITEVPGEVDLAVLAVPAAEVAGVVGQCGAHGVRGLVVMSGGFGESGSPEARASRCPGAARTRLGGPRVRHAGGRAELPGTDQHRSGGVAERLAGAGRTAGRPGRFLLPVRGARGRGARRGRPARAGGVEFRLGRQPGRRVGQRPAAVLGERPGDRDRPAVPGELRKSTQVRQDRPPVRAPQTHRGRQERPGLDGGRAAAHLGGGARSQRPGVVRGVRGDPHRDAGAAVRRGPAAEHPTATGRRSGCRGGAFHRPGNPGDRRVGRCRDPTRPAGGRGRDGQPGGVRRRGDRGAGGAETWTR